MHCSTRLLLAGFLIVSFTAVGCGVENDDANPDDTDTTESALGSAAVGMTMRAFTPKNLVVKKGTTVTFTNTSAIPHTVTSGATSRATDGPGALFDSVVAPRASFKVTFNTVGVQPYFCRPHEQMGMKGTITVTN